MNATDYETGLKTGEFTTLAAVYKALDELVADYRSRGLFDHADAVLVASTRIATSRRESCA